MPSRFALAPRREDDLALDPDGAGAPRPGALLQQVGEQRFLAQTGFGWLAEATHAVGVGRSPARRRWR